MTNEKKENSPLGEFSCQKRRIDLMTQSALSECIIRANPEIHHEKSRKIRIFLELAQKMQSKSLIFAFCIGLSFQFVRDHAEMKSFPYNTANRGKLQAVRALQDSCLRKRWGA